MAPLMSLVAACVSFYTAVQAQKLQRQLKDVDIRLQFNNTSVAQFENLARQIERRIEDIKRLEYISHLDGAGRLLLDETRSRLDAIAPLSAASAPLFLRDRFALPRDMDAWKMAVSQAAFDHISLHRTQLLDDARRGVTHAPGG